MANPQTRAIAVAVAQERIRAVLREFFPAAPMPDVPQYSKYGLDHLRQMQWEALADYFESLRGLFQNPDAVDVTASPEIADAVHQAANPYAQTPRDELNALVKERDLTDFVRGSGARGYVQRVDLESILLWDDAGRPDVRVQMDAVDEPEGGDDDAANPAADSAD